MSRYFDGFFDATREKLGKKILMRGESKTKSFVFNQVSFVDNNLRGMYHRVEKDFV